MHRSIYFDGRHLSPFIYHFHALLRQSQQGRGAQHTATVPQRRLPRGSRWSSTARWYRRRRTPVASPGGLQQHHIHPVSRPGTFNASGGFTFPLPKTGHFWLGKQPPGGAKKIIHKELKKIMLLRHCHCSLFYRRGGGSGPEKSQSITLEKKDGHSGGLVSQWLTSDSQPRRHGVVEVCALSWQFRPKFPPVKKAGRTWGPPLKV